MVPKLLGQEKRLDQKRVVDATTESMTIRDPHTAVIPKNMSHRIGRVITIPTVVPNILTLDRLVAALAVAFDTHLRPDSNL
jgi:hypothetical protein